MQSDTKANFSLLLVPSAEGGGMEIRMKIIFGLWIAILSLFIVYVKLQPKYKKIHCLDAVGFLLADNWKQCMKKLQLPWYLDLQKKETDTLRAIYPSESVEEKRKQLDGKCWRLIFVCLFLGSILGEFGCMNAEQKVSIVENQVLRPSFGEETQSADFVLEYGENSRNITVKLPEQNPTVEQIQTQLDAVFMSLGSQILNENESLDAVSTDLSLPTQLSNGVTVSWSSSDPEWIDDRGHIVTQDIADEGQVVEYQVILTYQEVQVVYTLPLRLLPIPKDWDWIQNTILEQIEEQKTSESNWIQLPDEIDGIALTWKTKTDYTWHVVGIFLPILAGVLGVLQRKRMNETYKKREQQLAADYCHIVTSMSMLISSGMTIRGAWRQLVFHYEKEREQNRAPMRYAYEEMRLTLRDIGNGESESHCYAQFGQRCNSYQYMRFAHLLEQGLRQGGRDLASLLEAEALRALEERKNEALKKGENMEATLMFPMFLLLGIVLVVLMAPAFLSFI